MFFFLKKRSDFFPFTMRGAIFHFSMSLGGRVYLLGDCLETLKKDVKIHLGSQSVPSTKGKTAICRSNFRSEKHLPAALVGCEGVL